MSVSSKDPGFPNPADVVFGRSAEDFPVACVGENAFAMLPGRDGRHYLATGWRVARPLAQWTRADFFGHSGELADEAAFRSHVLESAQHQHEKRALGRREIQSRAHTPWGVSQGATVYTEGVVVHSTAGHGGFHLSAARNALVHPMLRLDSAWYEEDCEWAIVAFSFPELFTSFERRCAERTIKDYWPDAWETISGRILAPGESTEKDRRAFALAHTSDWVVVCAIASEHHAGLVEAIATRGGRRETGLEQRRFLIPSGEYAIGRFGFVVDEARCQPYDGPSSMPVRGGV
ncbi:MAG: hypothetical protein KGM42_00515 [Hyphomicrobiales bacterium]|nr:hypothetical protein [Hyphomicrobiales bacterium]